LDIVSGVIIKHDSINECPAPTCFAVGHLIKKSWGGGVASLPATGFKKSSIFIGLAVAYKISLDRLWRRFKKSSIFYCGGCCCCCCSARGGARGGGAIISQ